MLMRFASLLIALFLLPAAVTGFALHSTSGPHIADVNVLLPPKMTNPVEYRLQGSGGCFKWSWDHHDILSVLPEYNTSSQCSTSARLKSIAPYSGRKETAVYATDVPTGMVIRCKVYIDKISRIQIFHSSIKLDLDGLATLRARAFDDEENVFSSVVGLKFMWKLMPETPGLPRHLTHVPLKDSPLSDCGGLCGDLDIQIRIEDNGVFSDLFVVKGTEIGHEIVSVHLLEPPSEPLADKISLTVAEAMSLDPPSPVFVLIGANVHYSLKVIRGNIPHMVALPSPFHRWSSSNSSVAQVDKMMGKAYGLSLGVTAIIVEDTRVAGHTQMSSLHVVLPGTLCLYISPLSVSGDLVPGIKPVPSGSCWYVVSGRQYLIEMKAYSLRPEVHEIYLTETDDVKMLDNQSDYWNLFPVSESFAVNHGWRNSRILKAMSHGYGKLTATLTYSSSETNAVLKVVQEVMVCEQVQFSIKQISHASQNIILPWFPAVYQEVELEVTGGCAKVSSDYIWFSSDVATVSVSPFGMVQAKMPGKATIKVISIFDSLNYDEIVIEVLIPSSMIMLPNFPVEVVVGSHLRAAVTLKAPNGASFYQCDAFSSAVRWKTGSESFAVVNATREAFLLELSESFTSLPGPPCACTHIYASRSGRTMLHATLSADYKHFDHPLGGPVVLKASARIAAYLPLTVHQAGDGNQFGGYWFDLAQAEAHKQLQNLEYLYLAPGTHLDVMLLGGPEKWDDGIEFIENVDIIFEGHTHFIDEVLEIKFDGHTNLKDGVLIYKVSTSHGDPYRVFCRNLGTFKLVFRRGNLFGDGHPRLSLAEIELLITCSLPSSIVLIVDEPVNALEMIWTATQADRSPGRIRATPITVANGRTIRISAVGISNTGKAFGNSSSLSLKWELSSCNRLAYWDDAYSLATRSSWERFLALFNMSGLCIARATVTGFTDAMGNRSYGPQFESSKSLLTDAVRLQLVSTLKVIPAFNLLYFSPTAKLNLSITGGSCFLDVMVNDTQILEVIQPPPGLECSQLVLAPKALGTALVTVYDIGLAPPLAASSVIQVADIDWIKITSGDEMSLMEGTLLSFNFLAGVNDGSAFNPSQYVYMNIYVHIEDPIVELVADDEFPSPIDGYVRGPSFTIHAKHLGITTLYLSGRQKSGREILSQSIKVEVYTLPRIHPGDIFLLPGASYLLSVLGGPTIGAYVEYASMDDHTATVHKSNGRLSAISPGNTTLVATVYGNGNDIICRAYGSVKVGLPPSAILNVQSEQLAVGRWMPIYPSLTEGDLFSLYGLCEGYRWTIEDEEVVNFQVPEHLNSDKHGTTFADSKQMKSTSNLDMHDLGFKQVIYGRSAGRTDVAVSFSCNFISGSFSQTRSYSASILLWVVPDLPLALGAPITWVLPPHYITTNLLPTSANTHSQLDVQSRKGTIFYSLLRDCSGKNPDAKDDAISIEGGRIRTAGSNNPVCVLAKDRSSGRTEVACCVRVAEVSQIRITNREFPFHTINLAVGGEFDLPVNYYDNLGYPFLEASNVILFDVETNYPDVVSITKPRNGKGNIHLKALHHGRALLRISSNNGQKSDFMIISVGAHIYPQNAVLYVGSRLNFSVEGLNDHVFGRWLSANGSVISVDMLSGRSEATGEGTTLVIFEGSTVKLQTIVTVLKGTTVSVIAPKETLTNVPNPAKGHFFSVRFSGALNQSLEATGSGSLIQYDCHVNPSYIGYTKLWQDLNNGNSYCLFFPYSPEHLAHSIPKLKDLQQDIYVSINASLRGANHISGSSSALFVGGFSILGVNENAMKLNLNSNCNRSIITLVGNTDVEVYWHDRDRLMVSLINREGLGIGGRAQYEVRALGVERFRDKVIMTLPANSQKVEVDVNYEPGEITASVTHKVALWAVLPVCFAILVMTVAIFICFLDRSDRRLVPAAATPSVTAPPATPNNRTPTNLNEQSPPRTPQPFVEYVRRTIDETPFYRQEGRRRRVNPQYTY